MPLVPTADLYLSLGEVSAAAGAPVGDADEGFQVGEDERAVPVAQSENRASPQLVELVQVDGERRGEAAEHRGDFAGRPLFQAEDRLLGRRRVWVARIADL